MHNSWSKQSYVQGFDCEYISLKKYFNMFDQMEVAESIYEGVVELSYKKISRKDTNRSGNISNKRGEPALSQTYPVMGESFGKSRKNM